MSDGELVFIAFLSLILAPDEFGSDLYCVEEPENHLHPRLIETLFHLLKQVRLSREAEQASQVILSTHSPLLVDLCDLDDLIVVERRQGATECTRPSAKGHLKALLEREEAGLGTLFYSGALSGAE